MSVSCCFQVTQTPLSRAFCSFFCAHMYFAEGPVEIFVAQGTIFSVRLVLIAFMLGYLNIGT